MTTGSWVTFLLAAGLGACGRYLVSLWVQRGTGGRRPWGTFVVNVAGCLAAGVLAGLATHHGLSAEVVTVVAVGGLGSFTTFSTFAFETVRLTEEGEARAGLANIAGTVLACGGAAAVGIGLVSIW